jgi:hypothetical protein
LLFKKSKDSLNMNDSDEWGRDPSVQIMRKVFKAMEKAQRALLSRLDISPYDLRIRKWREQSLALFEETWKVANRNGIIMDEAMASAVYCHCLAKVIDSEGHKVPEDIVPKGKDVAWLFKEVLQ